MGSKRRRQLEVAAASVGLFAGLVVIFQVLLPVLGVKSYVLPTPGAIWSVWTRDLATASYWGDILTTLEEIVLGWGIGVIFGLAIGILLLQSDFVESALTPYIVASQAVPKVALAPVLVVALGYGITSKVVIAALVAFFPVLVNTMIGIRSTDPLLMELMASLQATRLQVLRWTQLPSALPIILGGVEVAIVFAVVGAIIGEFTGATSGLGYLIISRDYNLDQAGVFSALLTLSLMGLGLDLAVKYIGRFMVRWRQIPDAVGM